MLRFVIENLKFQAKSINCAAYVLFGFKNYIFYEKTQFFLQKMVINLQVDLSLK